MGERETCAACGREVATYAVGAVSPATCSWSPVCGCAYCSALCFHVGDADECAAMLGGWPAVVRATRAALAAAEAERDRARAQVRRGVEWDHAVEDVIGVARCDFWYERVLAEIKRLRTARAAGLTEVPTVRKPRRWDAVSARLAVCIAGRNRRRR